MTITIHVYRMKVGAAACRSKGVCPGCSIVYSLAGSRLTIVPLHPHFLEDLGFHLFQSVPRNINTCRHADAHITLV